MQDLVRTFKTIFLGLAVYLAGVVLLFAEHIPSLLNFYDNDDNSYCYLVPLVFVYLVWIHRQELYLDRAGRWLGWLALGVCGLFFLAGRLGSLQVLVFAALWLTMVAGFLLVYGRRALERLWFAFLVLAFMVPLPPFINNLMTFRLRLISSELAVVILQALGVPTYLEGNIIDLGVTQLQVVNACSGLRYFMPAVLLALLVGRFFLRGWWRRLILLAAAGPVTVVANAFRIATTGVLIKHVSPALGKGFFHDFSGLMVFVLSVVLLGALAYVLNKIGPRPAPEEAAAAEPEDEDLELEIVDASAKQGFLARYGLQGRILVHLALGALFLVAVFWAEVGLRTVQHTPPRDSFEHFPMTIGDWTGERFFLDKETLDALWADDYVTGTYVDEANGQRLHLLISYYGHQTTEHTAHAPTSCLVGGGWELTTKDVAPANAVRSFPVARMLLEQPGGKIMSNFWFMQRGRVITNEYLNKLYLIWDSIRMGRSDGALVRVELFLLPGQTLAEAQALLDPFLVELYRTLERHVPGR